MLEVRLAHCYLRHALPVVLATEQSLARVGVDGHGPCEVGGVDCAVAFFAIQLPETFVHVGVLLLWYGLAVYSLITDGCLRSETVLTRSPADSLASFRC